MRPQPGSGAGEASAHPDDTSLFSPSPLRLGAGASGVVVLHGLTGTPYEVAPVAHALADAGYAVRVPLLPGHDAVESLEASTWHQWYAAAEAELDALLSAAKGPRRRVVVAGFSMGSLLALRLAALRPHDVSGVVAMSVPLELPPWQRRIIGVLSDLRARPLLGPLVGMWPKRIGPDVRIERELRRSPSLTAFPYPTLCQLVELQDEVARLLPMVRAPLLLIHGRLDHTAPAELSQRVAQRVGSERVQRVILPRSFHIIARDLDADRVCHETTCFVQSILPASPKGDPA